VALGVLGEAARAPWRPLDEHLAADANQGSSIDAAG
jgi:hypothetical protein